MNCSRGFAQFLCLVLFCFIGIPIWMDPPIRLPAEYVEKLFRDFVVKYNKSYANGQNPEEFQKRLGIFATALSDTAKFNAKHGDNVGSARFGITRYSDLTEDEFLSLYLNKHIAMRLKINEMNEVTGENDVDRSDFEKYNHAYAIKRTLEASLPLKVDWRDKKVIPAVRKQGRCGACWAYSVVSNIESMIAMRNQTIISLSTQQLIDCARNGNSGCEGGDTCLLLEWLKFNNIKIETNEEYPDTNEPNATCSAKTDQRDYYSIVDFSCRSYVKSEEKILHILANYGPVTVAVNAMLWQNYLGGIIQYHCDGAIANLNHALLIVGYDRSDPIPHYIAQNSWGSDFGDNGYVKIAYGNNVCGIANQVSTIKLD